MNNRVGYQTVITIQEIKDVIEVVEDRLMDIGPAPYGDDLAGQGDKEGIRITFMELIELLANVSYKIRIEEELNAM